MNRVREIGRVNEAELRAGIPESASWHAAFAGNAWIVATGVQPNLTEGDCIAVFSQWGEIEDARLLRHEETGVSKGVLFVKYEDARSAVLAVDNMNGVDLCGRTLYVDHKMHMDKPKKEAVKAAQDGAHALGAEVDDPAAARPSASRFSLADGVNLYAPQLPQPPVPTPPPSAPLSTPSQLHSDTSAMLAAGAHPLPSTTPAKAGDDESESNRSSGRRHRRRHHHHRHRSRTRSHSSEPRGGRHHRDVRAKTKVADEDDTGERSSGRHGHRRHRDGHTDADAARHDAHAPRRARLDADAEAEGVNNTAAGDVRRARSRSREHRHRDDRHAHDRRRAGAHHEHDEHDERGPTMRERVAAPTSTSVPTPLPRAGAGTEARVGPTMDAAAMPGAVRNWKGQLVVPAA